MIDYVIPADPDSLAPYWHASPYATEIVARLFGDGLMRFNPESWEPEPALAAALPDVSGDQKTYTFTVRPGVTFHDGTPVTALNDDTLEMTTHDVFAPLLAGTAIQAESGRTLADFGDAEQVDPWAVAAVTRLVEAGVASGSGGALVPRATTTRAEMAQVRYNLLGR